MGLLRRNEKGLQWSGETLNPNSKLLLDYPFRIKTLEYQKFTTPLKSSPAPCSDSANNPNPTSDSPPSPESPPLHNYTHTARKSRHCVEVKLHYRGRVALPQKRKLRYCTVEVACNVVQKSRYCTVTVESRCRTHPRTNASRIVSH